MISKNDDNAKKKDNDNFDNDIDTDADNDVNGNYINNHTANDNDYIFNSNDKIDENNNDNNYNDDDDDDNNNNNNNNNNNEKWLQTNLYYNCKKYPLSPLKPRGLALISWHVPYNWV